MKTKNQINNDSPPLEGRQVNSGRVVKHDRRNYFNLPFNKNLIKRAKKLRKQGNLSEVLLWNRLKKNKLNNLKFNRQKIMGNYQFIWKKIKHQLQ